MSASFAGRKTQIVSMIQAKWDPGKGFIVVPCGSKIKILIIQVQSMSLSQAGFFMLPPRIWTSLEGGLLNSFGMEGKSVVMLTEAAK